MKKILIFISLVLVVIFLAYQFGLVDLLTDITKLRMYLENLGWWGYFIFIMLSIIVAVFLLPGQFLAIVGGLAYGGFIGGLLTVIGASIGASISFVIGKYVARDYILQRFSQEPAFQKIEQGVRENGLSFLIFTRLVPIFPFAIQSYAYAMTPMSVKKFSFISCLTMIPASFIYAFMASEIASKGVSVTLLLELTAAGVLLALLAYLPKKISKKINQLSTEYKKVK
ncbi:TVP38/TMEM64 family protein [Enterococcus dongliensis]|uniref:TVP38/TMEM64 family membrane protein n=1 Tax=Enterococcus dongliensis TaxID=2559925 RepID=A0AAP5KTH8_9ENTE|nr:TVP38/TMEM64 family protein [Enterococcus dongliensis]MDT2595688.1 TVP38/TMEM64 family protein [Enterococcus dongliensis]MDT2602648.1 TVP38/TMEM64 family protein [Enterococcus dongliensis]MDT2633864.1 TVP38/TMEM64 family protein [Enterococcus dongliensis]MDT2636300.1 TVP38/TMEM64 family protein [Enterococcus dongliensis]MDT2641522.1 TVP38/TMEM64 family protein [Enterococcus dongliensis]